MFTGIIEKTIKVLHVEVKNDSFLMTTECPFQDITLGESIALNGVCLTVISFDLKKTPAEMQFFISHETLHLTDLKYVQTGTLLNLERALLVSARLSGHMVQGHVDGIGKIHSIENGNSDSITLQVLVPQKLQKYCIKKGSICLSGISLTINEISEFTDDTFLVSIQIIPHTWKHTHLHTLQKGAALNIEVDLISKYVENFITPSLNSPH